MSDPLDLPEWDIPSRLDTDPDLPDRLRRIIDSQPYGVLATQYRSQPYGSLMAYIATPDLKEIVFETPQNTRKYRFLLECSRVAFLIDDRSTKDGVPDEVSALTATGDVVEAEDGPERERLAGLLLKKHPSFETYIKAPDTSIFRLKVRTYFLISGFDETKVWQP